MEINYTNLAKSLGKELIKAASKCKVRECDETEPGQFIAYVDEGNDTFDVSVGADADHNFIEPRCDCKSTRKICQHKAALMLFVADSTETTKKAVKKVKVKESETLAMPQRPKHPGLAKATVQHEQRAGTFIYQCLPRRNIQFDPGLCEILLLKPKKR